MKCEFIPFFLSGDFEAQAPKKAYLRKYSPLPPSTPLRIPYDPSSGQNLKVNNFSDNSQLFVRPDPRGRFLQDGAI